MRQSLQGKVIWLTGASSGIGEALAPALAAQGARLILSARRVDVLDRVKGGLRGLSGEAGAAVAVLGLDLAAPDTLADVAERAWATFGGIDIVIHNAGLAHRDLAVNTALDVDRHIMQVNYFGPVAITKALLPKMLARKQGRFVVISSLSGVFGVPRLSAYSASKHALHGFFESLRAETHGDGLRYSIIVPGFIRTPITVNALTGDGSRHGKMDAVQSEGMSAEACAARIVDAVGAGREEALVGGSEMLGVALGRLTPGLWRKIMRNHPMKAVRKLKQAVGLGAD